MSFFKRNKALVPSSSADERVVLTSGGGAELVHVEPELELSEGRELPTVVEHAVPSEGLAAKQPAKRKFVGMPIRILIGFLPEVKERDARDYALGVAEKHFDQPALAFYDAFKYRDGYAYEVHEGGVGLAYLPQIIDHFNALGPFREGEAERVYIRTGTRMVEVQRAREGLAAILLPESSAQEPTSWLEPKEKLSPAVNQRTGLLVMGAIFFITGFFAVIVGSLMTRYQPYEAPPAQSIARIAYSELPLAQWAQVESTPPQLYVAKLQFENGRWLPPTMKPVAQDTAPAFVPPPGGAPIPAPAN